MPWLLNLLYLCLLTALAPWLLYKAATTGKYRRGIIQKFCGDTTHPLLSKSWPGPTVWLHGVSVGEIHLLRGVVSAIKTRHPDWRLVVSTTTDTGYAEARKIFADLPVIWWPFDFTWAVGRALSYINPDLIVLGESELWPNFLYAAKKRGIPVAVINARTSPRSAARFERFAFLTRGLVQGVRLFAAQTDEYAARYRKFGAPHVIVTGSVKYDGAVSDRQNSRTIALSRLFNISESPLVWVAGSTQAPEEEICLAIFRKMLPLHPDLRMILVLREKDRFDDVARLLEQSGLPFVRRSQLSGPTSAPIILVDTIGELAAVWGLADVAFVGGSLDGRRGGQNMIEPAAYGAAVVFGQHTWNFKETVARLLAANAAYQVQDARALEDKMLQLLADQALRQKLGDAARDFVRSQQGATQRTLDALAGLLDNRASSHRAA